MKRKFLKDSVSVLGNRVLIIIITFTAGVLLARYLGPDGKGLMVALLVYPTIFVSLAELGIRQSVTYLIGKKELSEQDIIHQVLIFLIVSSISATIVVGGIFLALGNHNFTPNLILMAIFYIPITLAISYSQGIFLGREDITKFNITSRLPPAINLLLIIVFIITYKLSVDSAVLAVLISNAAVAFYALRELSRLSSSFKIKFNWIIFKRMINMGIIYAMALFILNMNYKVDVVILEHLATASEIGQYSIGVGIVELIWLLPSTLGVVIFSHGCNARDPAEFSRGMIKLYRVVFIVALLMGLLLFIVSEYFIPFVYGTNFSPGILALRILLPGVIVMTAFKVLNMDLAGKGKPIVSLIAFIPSLIINIVLNIMWIPPFGINGAALASTVSYIFGALLFLILYSHITQIQMREIMRFQLSDFDFLREYMHNKDKVM